MFIVSKVAMASLSLGVLVMGCQSQGSTSASNPAASTPSSMAVACTQCQTTYQRVPVMGGNPRDSFHIVQYRTLANHQCPDCRNVAKDFLTRGKVSVPGTIVHQCESCGGEVKVCHTEKM